MNRKVSKMTNLEDEMLYSILKNYYNLFHADLIFRAIKDENISVDAFKRGLEEIDIAEKYNDDADEFTPNEWRNV